jgi:hypothetical protein
MWAVEPASSSTKVPRPGGVPPGDGSTDMASAPTLTTQDSTARVSAAKDAHEPLRLRLKPKAPTTGWVDGGWWPRFARPGRRGSAPAHGAVGSAGVHRAGELLPGRWGPTVRKISFGGGVVRLAGYRSQHADTVDVLTARQRVTLLLVSPEDPRRPRMRH